MTMMFLKMIIMMMVIDAPDVGVDPNFLVSVRLNVHLIAHGLEGREQTLVMVMVMMRVVVMVMVMVMGIVKVTLDAHPADSVQQRSASAQATEVRRGHL
jgi:hypothetical protein